MRVWTTVEHYRGTNARVANCRTLQRGQCACGQLQNITEGPTHVKEPEEHSRRAKYVRGQP